MKQFSDAIAKSSCALLARHALIVLPGSAPPWSASGISLRRGQAYTLLADGIIRWSARHPQLYGGPGFHLWARVSPGGRIVNVTRQSGSFVADCDGELELGIYLGAWRDAYGALDTPPQAYARLQGELEVIALAWKGAAAAGLSSLAAQVPHALLTTELARVLDPILPPPGWDYLMETGTSDIYRDCSAAGHARICLTASDDQGIIRKVVDVALTPATVLSWRWRLDQHPSSVAEDSALTHDYVSIATEFDNGRDLTWIWSSRLAPGTHFPCPIKAWRARETHYVVRSGLGEAGVWCSDSRRVYDDVSVAMGEPPSRIVAVWLICVATFQHGTARGAFEDIRLGAGDVSQRVL